MISGLKPVLMLAQAGIVSTGKTDLENKVGLASISRAKFGKAALYSDKT